MKVRRSNRLVDMTRYLMEHPRTLVSLKFFSERFGSAKSSISEDLSIVKHTFHTWGEGRLETIPGASGGAVLTPLYSKENAQKPLGRPICSMRLSILPSSFRWRILGRISSGRWAA